MLATIASDHVIDTAYAWLCLRRKNWPANSDVWALRFCWPAEKARLGDARLPKPSVRAFASAFCLLAVNWGLASTEKAQPKRGIEVFGVAVAR